MKATVGLATNTGSRRRSGEFASYNSWEWHPHLVRGHAWCVHHGWVYRTGGRGMQTILAVEYAGS